MTNLVDEWLKKKNNKQQDYKTYSQLKQEILSEDIIRIDELVFSTSNKELQDYGRSLGATVGNNLIVFEDESTATLFQATYKKGETK